MLFNRVRPADTDGIMYHYCSPQTFLTILRNKTIRFSDINMLNDAEEAKWGYRVFIEAANRILKREDLPNEIPTVPEEFVDKIDEIWSGFQIRLLSFVSCFSTDGDSLSQWRAYADDGRGFAIGFKAKELRRLPIQILDVLYDHKQQIEEMVIAIGATFLEFQDKNKDYSQPWFFERCATLAASSAALKNPAWREEKEVRCHHVVDVKIDGGKWVLSDGGGIADGSDVAGHPIGFQIRNSAIVAYLDLPFEVSNAHQPIEEIVLGPKCASGFGNVQFLLGNSGYEGVNLNFAGAAYR